MNAADYLTHLILLGIVIAGFWSSARSLARLLISRFEGALAALGQIVLALSVAIVTCEVLGILGLLTAPALVLTSAATALGLRSQATEPWASRWTRAGPSGRLGFGLAVAAAVLTAIHWAGPVLHSLDVGIYRQDSTWYHLPFAAWIAHTGSIGGLLFTDPLKLTAWYYPLNAELIHTICMVLIGNDLISPLLNFGWMGVALLGAWCIGRPFGLAAATLLGTVLVVDSDMMMVQAGNAPGDIAALACLIAAIAILVNGSANLRLADGSSGRGQRLSIDTGALAVAALAAGLAIGTKLTMLVPVGVITVGIVVATGRAERGRRAAIWTGGLFATGGFWYLRNLIHAGNPLPWIQFGPLPGPDQEALYPRPAHAIAGYLTDRHAWTKFFFPGFEEVLGPLWYLILLAAFAGLVLGLRRRHSSLIRIVALAGIATLIAHVFNPISASGPQGGPYGFASNLRYAAPGLAIGLVLLPLCETRWTARRVLVPAYALLVVVGAISSSEWIQPNLAAAIALGTLAVLVAVWIARGSLRGARRAAVAALATTVVLVGYPVQRHYFEDRYRPDVAPALDNPGFRATPQWRLIQAWARDQRGLRIGIVGMPAAYGQYVFYGEDLSNEVRYIGEPQPHGGLTTIESCRRWRERIDANRFDAIVITPEDPRSPLLPPQIAWTAAGGSARQILRVPPAGVYVLTQPLNPSQCSQSQTHGRLPNEQPGGHFPPYFRR